MGHDEDRGGSATRGVGQTLGDSVYLLRRYWWCHIGQVCGPDKEAGTSSL